MKQKKKILPIYFTIFLFVICKYLFIQGRAWEAYLNLLLSMQVKQICHQQLLVLEVSGSIATTGAVTLLKTGVRNSIVSWNCDNIIGGPQMGVSINFLLYGMQLEFNRKFELTLIGGGRLCFCTVKLYVWELCIIHIGLLAELHNVYLICADQKSNQILLVFFFLERHGDKLHAILNKVNGDKLWYFQFEVIELTAPVQIKLSI